MHKSIIVKSAIFIGFFIVPAISSGQDNKKTSAGITLQGELGKAEKQAVERLFKPPFTSLEWLRADLTNETVSKDDKNDQSEWKRPFKYFSGDISGRYIELMALLSKGDLRYHPALNQFVNELPSRQQKDGHFGWAKIDWNTPIDFSSDGLSQSFMMPALWGNGRMLCGLVNGYVAFKDTRLLEAAKKLGDFYINTADRFMDPKRLAEYNSGGTYASGYVTCYFNAFEGLVKLYQTTRDIKYLHVAERMASFLVQFDHLPIDHTHGMLCNQNALLLLFEETGNKNYLDRVKDRWLAMVNGGYIDPAGGVLEEARIGYSRDEGCAETDWLRLNLELFKITGQTQYLDMADRLINNHFLINQNASGGFGHRFILNDKEGVIGFANYSQEATWCCDFHGTLGFQLLKPYVTQMDDQGLKVNFLMNFTAQLIAKNGNRWNIKSVIKLPKDSGIIKEQVVSVNSSQKGSIKLFVRLPDWADGIYATDSFGRKITLKPTGGYWCTEKEIPSGESVTISYKGGIQVENRNCKVLDLTENKSGYIGKVTLRLGPQILMLAGTSDIPVLSLQKNSKGKIILKGTDVGQATFMEYKNSITPVTLSPRPVGENVGKSVFVFDAILSNNAVD